MNAKTSPAARVPASTGAGAAIRHIRTITTRTTLDAIRAALVDDGYAVLAPRAAEIREAAMRGALLWTRKRLTTTDSSHIDARPS